MRGGPKAIAYVYEYVRVRKVMEKIEELRRGVEDEIFRCGEHMLECQAAGDERGLLDWKLVMEKLGGALEERVGSWERQKKLRAEALEKNRSKKVVL